MQTSPVASTAPSQARGCPVTKTSSAQRQSSTSSAESMYRTCPGCSRENQLARSDKHELCLFCLGCEHPIGTCKVCKGMGKKTQHEWACRLLWWRATGQLPTVRDVRKMFAQGQTPLAALTWDKVEEILHPGQLSHRPSQSSSTAAQVRSGVSIQQPAPRPGRQASQPDP